MICQGSSRRTLAGNQGRLCICIRSWRLRVEQLAKEIAGPSAGYARRAIACQAAHAAIDVARARQAKIAIFSRAVSAETTEVSDPTSTTSNPAMGEDATSRTARALRRALPDLLKLDRYESRALARRNRALAALRLLNTSEPIDDNGGGTADVRLRKPPKPEAMRASAKRAQSSLLGVNALESHLEFRRGRIHPG